MARGMSKESSPATLVGGWFLLMGLAFIFKLLPLVLVVCIIYYCFKGKEKEKSTKHTIPEQNVIVYDFDTFLADELSKPVVSESALSEQAKPSVPDNIIEDSVSVLVNLRTNKGLAKQAVDEAIENGATTIEEIIKQSLQLLNSHR
jgi:hypothetical protein